MSDAENIDPHREDHKAIPTPHSDPFAPTMTGEDHHAHETMDSPPPDSIPPDDFSIPSLSANETSLSGRYTLGKLLGEGGMATVVAAEDSNLDRIVAVKLLKAKLSGQADLRARFFNEARIMASLEHPGTVPVYEAGMLDSGECFYAMQRVKGKTFRVLMEERGDSSICCPHTTAHLIDQFERVCQTVAFAHARGVIHRDLKPENIMVDEFCSVRVMDWGLSKRLPKDHETVQDDILTTQAGVIQGTPAYMSPEQADGKVERIDYRTDVFALGIMLYEILTGRLPFAGRTHSETIDEVLHHEPPHPRFVRQAASRELSAICMKALAKDPHQRYKTARELAADLRAYREFRPVGAYPPRLRDRLQNWAKRNPRWTTAILTLVLVVGFSIAGMIVHCGMEASMVKRILAKVNAAQAEENKLIAEIDALDKTLAAVTQAAASKRKTLRQKRDRLIALRDLAEEKGMVLTAAAIGRTALAPDPHALAIARAHKIKTVERAIAQKRFTAALVLLDARVASDEAGKDILRWTAAEITHREKLRATAEAGLQAEK